MGAQVEVAIRAPVLDSMCVDVRIAALFRGISPRIDGRGEVIDASFFLQLFRGRVPPWGRCSAVLFANFYFPSSDEIKGFDRVYPSFPKARRAHSSRRARFAFQSLMGLWWPLDRSSHSWKAALQTEKGCSDSFCTGRETELL